MARLRPEAAAMAARLRAAVRNPPGVEPGVTGKERLFQQSRAFGPGPIVPYPPGTRSGAPDANRRMGDGVYRGPKRRRAQAA
jgi:hypothetical protein